MDTEPHVHEPRMDGGSLIYGDKSIYLTPYERLRPRCVRRHLKNLIKKHDRGSIAAGKPNAFDQVKDKVVARYAGKAWPTR